MNGARNSIFDPSQSIIFQTVGVYKDGILLTAQVRSEGLTSIPKLSDAGTGHGGKPSRYLEDKNGPRV